MHTRFVAAIVILSVMLLPKPVLSAEPLSPIIQADPPGTVVQADPSGPMLEEGPMIAPGEPVPALGCDEGACGERCPDQGDCPCPLHGPPGMRPLGRRVFAEYLYLRPGNDRVPFATQINAATLPLDGPALLIGREADADVQFQSGFRAGLSRRFTPFLELAATFTGFDGNDQTSVVPGAGNLVLWSLVDHPDATAAPTDFTSALATSDIRFRMLDVEFKRIVVWNPCYDVRWLAGIRYAHLTQDFSSSFTSDTTSQTVDTNIGFDGGGLRIGLEGERRNMLGWFIYGRGAASFVGGKFQADYVQSDNTRGRVVDAGWSEDRLISILDLELGLGWTAPGERLRLLAGYTVSAWYNPMRTNQFIRSVQTNGGIDAHDTLTFDGFFGRAELRY